MKTRLPFWRQRHARSDVIQEELTRAAVEKLARAREQGGALREALVRGHGCCQLVDPGFDQALWDEALQAQERIASTEEAFRRADEAASVAHDFIHNKNGVTKEQASTAIWVIHDALRPKHGLSRIDHE